MLTVHLIEDNEADAFFFSYKLKREERGWQLHVYADPEGALEAFRDTRAESVEIIILDINLPTMDGFELLERYAELPEAARAHRRVCIASGSVNPDDKKRASEHPLVCAYLEKPVELAVVEGLAANAD